MQKHNNNNKPSLEEFRARFNYNPETGLITNLKTGHVYRRDATGYVHLTLNGRYCRAHRVAWFMTYGEWPKELIDHINGDPGDNRLVNLREATMQQNLQNRPTHSRNKLGVKGVIKVRNRYRAQVFHDGKFVLVKDFKTIEEASAAYQAKAKEVFGEFHRPS